MAGSIPWDGVTGRLVWKSKCYYVRRIRILLTGAGQLGLAKEKISADNTGLWGIRRYGRHWDIYRQIICTYTIEIEPVIMRVL